MSAEPAKPFFDTTVLVYAVSDDRRSVRAATLLAAGGAISVQVLNEFTSVARRKLGMTWDSIGEALQSIRDLCAPALALDTEMHEQGLEIARRYGYHIYDALVIAAAMRAGDFAVLYSEDMQDGQTIGLLTIRNPFAPHTASH